VTHGFIETCRAKGLAETEGTMRTTKTRPEAEAERLVAALDRNGDDYHFRRIDHATHHARNEEIWREAETDPRVKELVLEGLRNR
jgi:hypothetical protein